MRKTPGKILKAPLEEGLPTSAFASPLETPPSVGGSLTSAFASTLEAPLADKVLTGETESSGSSGHSMTFEAFTLAMWALKGNRRDHGGQGHIEMMYYVAGGKKFCNLWSGHRLIAGDSHWSGYHWQNTMIRLEVTSQKGTCRGQSQPLFSWCVPATRWTVCPYSGLPW